VASDESAGEGEDEEIALAGNDHAEEAAVGRDGEVTEANAAENRDRFWLRNGDFFSGHCSDERREGDPDEVARFFF
jgi:hypothetical protein